MKYAVCTCDVIVCAEIKRVHTSPLSLLKALKVHIVGLQFEMNFSLNRGTRDTDFAAFACFRCASYVVDVVKQSVGSDSRPFRALHWAKKSLRFSAPLRRHKFTAISH